MLAAHLRSSVNFLMVFNRKIVHLDPHPCKFYIRRVETRDDYVMMRKSF